MNERIKELSKEAWAWAEQQEYTDPTKEFSDILEQKFAELIVRECLDIVEKRAGGPYIIPMSDVTRNAWNTWIEIKEHFGVEE